MSKAKWIWYYGDFEIYHSMLLHSRRNDYEAEYPPFWHLPQPYARVNFGTGFNCDKETLIKVISTGTGSVVIDNRRYPLNKDITVNTGEHRIFVQVMSLTGLPCIYIDSPYLKTDETWYANHAVGEYSPVGCTPAFYSPDKTPLVFPYEYEVLTPVSVERLDDGILYDFGKELFGIITVEATDENEVLVRFGESREEALDPVEAVIRHKLSGKISYELPSGAFRYIWLSRDVKLTAKYEYLPLKDVGSFTCDDERINKIWETCAYTFHLNSREFYLDGIKRDRWVWGGDAYQSFMVGAYLYDDQEITKRTILALLGKPPYEQHVNTIVDYTMYVIIGAYEYYYRSGDKDFIERIKPRVLELADFLFGRLDDDGLVCERPGDWIFIDWSDIDKDGPVCAEQILLWQTYKCLEALYGGDYSDRADKLKEKIMADFWDADRGAFIDCAVSGKNHISRHANIFAILYDFVDADTAEVITKNVLENNQITAITTPYFEFFELMALCKMGRFTRVLEMLDSYWGGMLDLGATSIWEEFDPTMKGTEHYAMYGSAYSKSLCHAWGSGPIFLLGRYCLGVYPTSPGYETYEVKPNTNFFKNFKGSVPIGKGRVVYVECQNGKITVREEK